MTIIGIGTDIIEIERFKDAYKRRGQKILDKIFTKNELKYCSKFKNPFPCYAARFAAKEAVVKSFGTGFSKGISFHQIEILNDLSGKPSVNLSEKLKKMLDSPKVLISISHCNTFAMAFCLTTK